MAALTWLLGALLCSAGFTMIVSADEMNFTAQHGDNVILPCGLPTTDQVVVLRWSRADLGSENVLLYQDEQIDPFNQHPSFMNRVDLVDRNMEDGIVSLVLKNVTTEDRGTYECRFTLNETDRRMNLICIINLVVTSPPPHHPPGENKITAEPGQNIILPCRTHNNQPAKVVVWRRTDLKREDYIALFRYHGLYFYSQHSAYKNHVDLQDRMMKDGNVSLVLKNVRNDHTGTYECEVVQKRNQRMTSSFPQTASICTISLDVSPLGDQKVNNGNVGNQGEDKGNGGNQEGNKWDKGRIIGLLLVFVLGPSFLLCVVFLLYIKKKFCFRGNNAPAVEAEHEPMNAENPPQA